MNDKELLVKRLKQVSEDPCSLYSKEELFELWVDCAVECGRKVYPTSLHKYFAVGMFFGIAISIIVPYLISTLN